MPLPPIYQTIMDDIQVAIRRGVLRPGERLPTHAELAAQYRCSEQPVKRAMDRLEAAGWVDLRRGGRARVADHPPL